MKPTWLSNRPETVYSHNKRLDWIVGRLKDSDRIVEVGCGTGAMICMPLSQAGFDVTGIDRDVASVRRGREIASELGLDPNLIRCGDLEQLDSPVSVAIVSEVMEHLDNSQLHELLTELVRVLQPGGRLLITVPNGFGWYEAESWLWRKTRLDRLVPGSWLERGVRYVKMRLSGYRVEQIVEPYPSSLDGSPHVQRFRLRTLPETLAEYGLEIRGSTGSGLVAGPLSNLLFTGLNPITRLNNRIGDRLPGLSSGFYFEFQKSRRMGA